MSAREATPESPPVRWRSHVLWLLVAVLLLIILGDILWRQVTLPKDDPLDGPQPEPRLKPHSTAFDLSDLTVDRGQILSGGPPKDGIPALTNPRLVSAAEAKYWRASDRVIGVALDGEARAYPLAILNYHEIVNDVLLETPIAVTYCPLCDSAVVFDRRTPLGLREFGVSGLLYNSNVLMYDRGGRTDSLWSQLQTQGISGPAARTSLQALPVELTTWGDWVERHPHTKVLSSDTGYERDYRVSPYEEYFGDPRLMFPVSPVDQQLPSKARVLGVWSGEEARAYPESAFDADHTQVTEELNGKRYTIKYNPASKGLRVAEADSGVQWMYSFWFGWHAFRPKATLYAR